MLRRLLLLISIALITLITAQAQTVLTADQLQNGQSVELDKLGWKYAPGDELRFADPQFDDSAWEMLNGTAITLDSIPKSGWRGIGWFRLRLKIDDALVNQQLALIMDHWGASEVYVDGKLINRFGKVGTTAETEEAFRPNKIPVLFNFDANQREHLIAVRHSVMLLRDANSLQSRILTNRLGSLGSSKNAAGLEVSLTKSENAALNYEYAQKIQVGNRFGRGGLILMIGLLFLMLYLFYPSLRANLYFSVCAIFVFLNVMSVLVRETTHYDLPLVAISAFLSDLSWSVELIFLLIFLYTAFYKSIPKYFWLYVAAYSVYILASPFLAKTGTDSLLLIALNSFALIESIRIIVKALIERQSGAWIVGIGIALFGVLILQNVILAMFLLSNLQTPFPALFIFYSRQFSTLGLTIPIAIYLAQQFAQTNKTLEAQLIKQVEHERDNARFQIVEAENDRRAAELEEARQLQLSMLPKKLPNLPHLDIAAYMKTASEVGGDYYDFHTSEDGTLTIAVGDATGHGLKAGTLVSVVKGLFVSLAYHPDIPHIFHRVSAVLKEMKLRGLFMAMTMVKVKGNHMTVSIAGMPSVLIYRALSGCVEEVVMRALPLGGMTKYEYRQRELTLAVDDVVVLMSDGLPERFNSRDEMLEEEAAKQYLAEHAQASAQEIINGLATLGDDWGGARPQDDDVTFVVLKHVECGRLAAAFRS